MVSILNQNEDIFELVLDEKVILTHDTNRYRFKLPNENDVLGLPVGKHLSLIGLDNEGEQVSRSYTPVSTDNNKGYVDFVIKTYKKNQHPEKLLFKLQGLKEDIKQQLDMSKDTFYGVFPLSRFFNNNAFFDMKSERIFSSDAQNFLFIISVFGMTSLLTNS